MLEAYDLVPVIDCLKLPNMDSVEACMDTLSPWLSLGEDGQLSFSLSLNAVNGFIGGSVGVMGTVAATMIKKGQVKDRLKCTYCGGTGRITCGYCYGTAMVDEIANEPNADGEAQWARVQCHNCPPDGSVVCINCQGSGLNVPDDLIQKLGDAEVGFTDEDYIGLFDEVKFPSASGGVVKLGGTGPQHSPAAAQPPAAPQKAKEPAGGVPETSEPFDPSGGLG